jgi:hypothetical protein
MRTSSEKGVDRSPGFARSRTLVRGWHGSSLSCYKHGAQNVETPDRKRLRILRALALRPNNFRWTVAAQSHKDS